MHRSQAKSYLKNHINQRLFLLSFRLQCIYNWKALAVHILNREIKGIKNWKICTFYGPNSRKQKVIFLSQSYFTFCNDLFVLGNCINCLLNIFGMIYKYIITLENYLLQSRFKNHDLQ